MKSSFYSSADEKVVNWLKKDISVLSIGIQNLLFIGEVNFDKVLNYLDYLKVKVEDVKKGNRDKDNFMYSSLENSSEVVDMFINENSNHATETVDANTAKRLKWEFLVLSEGIENKKNINEIDLGQISSYIDHLQTLVEDLKNGVRATDAFLSINPSEVKDIFSKKQIKKK